MKKITISCLLPFLAVLVSTKGLSQLASPKTSHRGLETIYPAASGNQLPTQARTTAVTNCSDKINYVGNTASLVAGIGGPSSTNHAIGIYQVFPSYEGEVTGVEFVAGKNATTTTNPVLLAGVFALDFNGNPLINSPISALMPVTIANNAPANFSVTFPAPVTIPSAYNGFAIGIVNYTSTVRAELYFGPQQFSSFNDYAFVRNSSNPGSIYGASYYYGLSYPIYALVRPTVTTSVNPTWTAMRTSTGCNVPVDYNFNNTSGAVSGYVFDPMISPSGLEEELDFGDSSPSVTSFIQANHTYTAVGNYVASFTQTYKGWTNDCVQTLTMNIVIDNPVPAFTYTVNGLNVTFNNTSVGMTNFVWNFGDLTTSTQQNPGSHNFSSPGTYVVELEGTASCGKVRYAASIVVTATGINETQANIGFAIYPNPANTRLYIRSNDQNAVGPAVMVFDAQGALVNAPVVKAPNGLTEINVSNLRSGIYFMQVETPNGPLVRTFIRE